MYDSAGIVPQNNCSTASFWECREYQRTVKRVEAANKLCSGLSMLIQERAEVEKAYSSNLRRWISRVFSFLESGFEYGTAITMWKGLCKEAEAISNAHQNIRDMLLDEIQTGLKHWQKEHFHKTPLPPNTLKESKQFEQEFEHAQKPWAKRLKRVDQYKKEYHQCCQTVRSLQVHVQNAKTDPAGTPEHLRKMQEKLTKAEKEMDRTRSLYNSALNDLNCDNPRYLEEMTKIFNKTQEFERERLLFFKNVFTNLHGALNVSTKADFPTIYNELEGSIAKCDIDCDLAWWSTHHGVDMPAMFPQFEEYSPESNTISSKKRSQISDSSARVTLPGVSPIISSTPHVSESPTNGDPTSNVVSANGIHSILPTPFDDPPPTTNENTVMTDVPPTNVHVASTEEASDADYYTSATYDDGRPGVPVRALYDYTSQEEDELTLVAGDVFEKLEEADDQGWCKGRKDGRAGLYPANYVENI